MNPASGNKRERENESFRLIIDCEDEDTYDKLKYVMEKYCTNIEINPEESVKSKQFKRIDKMKIEPNTTGFPVGSIEYILHKKGLHLSDVGINQTLKRNKKEKKVMRTENGEENILVFPIDNDIFALDANKLHLIESGIKGIDALCSSNGILYHAEYTKIFETLSRKKIASGWGMIQKICSHNGALYDLRDSSKIFETLSGKKIALDKRGLIKTIFSHNNTLYHNDGWRKNRIIETFSRKKIEIPFYSVDVLHSHKGILYNTCNNEIYETFSRKKIASRKESVLALCTNNGVLYDTGYCGKIFETFSGREVYSVMDRLIGSMCSHPKKDFVEAGILK